MHRASRCVMLTGAALLVVWMVAGCGGGNEAPRLASGADVSSAAAGGAAQTTGSVVQWGNASEWALPTPNENFTAIAAGMSHDLGLRADSSIDTWGRDYHGECDVPNPNRNFVAVSAFYRHSLGLKKNGTVLAWGLNDPGYYEDPPPDPPGPCDVPEPNRNFVAISTGHYHSLGLKDDGSVVAWGRPVNGQCDVPEPNVDFVAIAAGVYHSLGLKSDGSIAVWGSHAEVPSPNTGFVAIAASCGWSLGLKSDGTIVPWGMLDMGQGAVPEPNSGFVAIAAGTDHSLGLKQDGTVLAWGFNHLGQCNVPEPNRNFVAIVASAHQSVALQVDEPPVAQDDAYATPADTTLVVEAPGILGNDTDPSGHHLEVYSNTEPTNGTLTLDPDGSFTYTPASGFTGTDSFTYTVWDLARESNAATVAITVGGAVESGGITGTVTYAGGPVKKATVTAWLDGLTEVASASTNPHGKYTFSGLDPGNYVVVAAKDDLDGSASATVYSGETTTGVDIFIE